MTVVIPPLAITGKEEDDDELEVLTSGKVEDDDELEEVTTGGPKYNRSITWAAKVA